LDTLPPVDSSFDGQELTFKRFGLSKENQLGKLQCIFNYIEVCRQRIAANHTWTGTDIAIYRRHISNLNLDDWCSNGNLLSKFVVSEFGSIEAAQGALQADFANEYIGGGVLGSGCVQVDYCVSLLSINIRTYRMTSFCFVCHCGLDCSGGDKICS
jgi:hypothetical protein